MKEKRQGRKRARERRNIHRKSRNSFKTEIEYLSDGTVIERKKLQEQRWRIPKTDTREAF